MPIAIYECTMGHVVSFTPGTCIECGGQLVSFEYARVRGEWETPFEERIQVDTDRSVYFMDRYWRGNCIDPGITWKLTSSGWDAYVQFRNTLVLLVRTKTVAFPNPDNIQIARNAYEDWKRDKVLDD